MSQIYNAYIRKHGNKRTFKQLHVSVLLNDQEYVLTALIHNTPQEVLFDNFDVNVLIIKAVDTKDANIVFY